MGLADSLLHIDVSRIGQLADLPRKLGGSGIGVLLIDKLEGCKRGTLASSVEWGVLNA